MYPGLGGQYGGQGGYGGEYPGQQPTGYPGHQPGGYMGQQGGGYAGQPQPGGYAGQQPGRYGDGQTSGFQPGGYGGQQPQMGGQQPQMGGQQPQMGGQQPQMGGQQHPGYAPSPGGGSSEISQWFNAVDTDRSGKINSKELQAALVNGQGKNFSDVACQMMIGMFDQDKSGTIDVNEFQQLYNYINQWLSVFRTYDRDQSGHIEETELSQALQQMGFRFSPQFVSFLITKSDMERHKQISVDQFIVLCVQIQRFTEAFRSRDAEKSGMITIAFEDFLGIALSCSV